MPPPRGVQREVVSGRELQRRARRQERQLQQRSRQARREARQQAVEQAREQGIDVEPGDVEVETQPAEGGGLEFTARVPEEVVRKQVQVRQEAERQEQLRELQREVREETGARSTVTFIEEGESGDERVVVEPVEESIPEKRRREMEREARREEVTTGVGPIETVREEAREIVFENPVAETLGGIQESGGQTIRDVQTEARNIIAGPIPGIEEVEQTRREAGEEIRQVQTESRKAVLDVAPDVGPEALGAAGVAVVTPEPASSLGGFGVLTLGGAAASLEQGDRSLDVFGGSEIPRPQRQRQFPRELERPESQRVFGPELQRPASQRVFAAELQRPEDFRTFGGPEIEAPERSPAAQQRDPFEIQLQQMAGRVTGREERRRRERRRLAGSISGGEIMEREELEEAREEDLPSTPRREIERELERRGGRRRLIPDVVRELERGGEPLGRETRNILGNLNPRRRGIVAGDLAREISRRGIDVEEELEILGRRETSSMFFRDLRRELERRGTLDEVEPPTPESIELLERERERTERIPFIDPIGEQNIDVQEEVRQRLAEGVETDFLAEDLMERPRQVPREALIPAVFSDLGEDSRPDALPDALEDIVPLQSPFVSEMARAAPQQMQGQLTRAQQLARQQQVISQQQLARGVEINRNRQRQAFERPLENRFEPQEFPREFEFEFAYDFGFGTGVPEGGQLPEPSDDELDEMFGEFGLFIQNPIPDFENGFGQPIEFEGMFEEMDFFGGMNNER